MNRIFRVDFYPHEWIALTAHMKPDQKGVFIDICALIYAHRGPIINDPKHISRVSNCSLRMAKTIIQQLADQGDIIIFTENSASKISQKRCETELNVKRNYIESGSRGGRIRAENERQNSKNNELPSSESKKSLQATPSSSTLPYPTQEKKEESVIETDSSEPIKIPIKKRSQKKQVCYSPDFDQFWQSYPRRDGSKLTAFESYVKILEGGITHDAIIRGAGAYSAFIAGEGIDEQYIAHAATWLNQRRWESDYTPKSHKINGNGQNGNGFHQQPTKYERAMAASMRAAEKFGLVPKSSGPEGVGEGDQQTLPRDENLRERA